MDPNELDWLTNINIETTESSVLMTVTYDYPTQAKKPLRHASVKVTLSRLAGDIGYNESKVMPTFYHGDLADPDFRLKHGID